MEQSLSRRIFLKLVAISTGSGFLPGCTVLKQPAAKRTQPNIVIIFLDDAGWLDFEPFGSPSFQTPHVNQLAAEGRRFNHFYVPQAICSASRASLLSGCYPGRTRVFGAHAPRGRGLGPEFAIMSEIFGVNGYKSACFGKWHIGDQDGTRPWDRGFDESCGLLYSNDMWEHHPEDPDFWGKYPLQYFENGRVQIERVTKNDQSMLTTWYTEKAVDFIERHKNEPFFLYVPHTMPHVPLFVSEKFEGQSGAGLYGDVIMELDWSVGQITKALRDNGLEQDTIVIFTSDNGPWIGYGNHAGQTPFRGSKATSFDGGVRSPCIIKYPGHIPAGTTSNQMFCTVDLLPTLANLTGASLPENTIDGKDVWDIIVGKPKAKNPHTYYPFSTGSEFQGVISSDGRWKLHLPHSYRTLETPGQDGKPGKYRRGRIELSLFDIENDPYETMDVQDQYPEVLKKLQRYANMHSETFYRNQK